MVAVSLSDRKELRSAPPVGPVGAEESEHFAVFAFEFNVGRGVNRMSGLVNYEPCPGPWV